LVLGIGCIGGGRESFAELQQDRVIAMDMVRWASPRAEMTEPNTSDFGFFGVTTALTGFTLNIRKSTVFAVRF
jgi:hypothetical protein